MNLDELQSIRDRERQSDSLQQLRETFYADAGEFVQQLRDERDQAAARADDPFDAPEVNRLTDDIKTAEQTIEAIYERRVGKLVKMASFAAADMPTEDEGLTAEERELFEHLVASIEQNRDQVFAILDGDEVDSQSTPSPLEGTTTDSTPDPAPTEGVDAADLMGGTDSASGETGAEASASADSPTEPSSDREPPAPADDPGSESVSEASGADRPTTEAESVTDAGQSESTGDTSSRVPPDEPPEQATEPDILSDDGDADGPDAVPSEQQRSGETDGDSERRSDGGGPATIDRTTVRITRDVGEIFGVDEREYDLSSEDVVTLPATNADPLVERDAAERLD